MNTLAAFKISWRVGLAKYETDEAFARILAFIKDNAAVVDEIALFDSWTHHLYIPLEEYAQRAELMGKRLRGLKKVGVKSTGINVLTTIGHINEAWDSMPALPFDAMVGHDGAVSTGCACPNTPEFREYLRAKYRLVAQQNPDFVWVDDDIRMHHHGVAFGCFCPTCLGILSQTTGKSWSREVLVQELSLPENESLRGAWVKQNIRVIEELMEEIEKTLHAVNPAIGTGLMTAGPGWTTYTGHAFRRWFPALKANRSRPGGGFYSDTHRLDLLDKIYDTGRQHADLPVGVDDCQYELENFPYQTLNKSVGSVMNECTLALGTGLNGIAFNCLGMWDGSLEEFDPIAKQAAQMRPVWEAWVTHSAGLPTAGLWTAWSSQLMARRKVYPGEDWFKSNRGYEFMRSHQLGHIGLPLAVDFPADATILYGRVAEAFTDQEFRQILGKGVLMDSEALAVLENRGLGHLSGVRIKERLDNGAMERFSADALNGRFVGERRDARIEFWGDSRGMADVLEPLSGDVRVLAEMEDYFKRVKGSCLTAYENELGGRVVVMGYAPWMFLYSLPKREQLLNLADWVTHSRLPVRIDEALTLTPIMRLSQDRQRGAVMLFNWGLDEIAKATVHFRLENRSIRFLTPQGEQPMETRLDLGGYRVELKNILPWSVTCLVIGG